MLRSNRVTAILATGALLAGSACGSSPTGTTITVLGYTVVVTTAPPVTALISTSVPVAFTVTERMSDGSSHPAGGKSFTVAVTAGGGTVNGAASAALTTGADGSVSLVWILGSTVGTQTVRGSVTADQFLDVSVTATVPAVSTVTVTLATPSIILGTIGDQATAVVKDADGNVLQGRTVTWQSSNLAVATISGSGVITTVGVGTSTIIATSENQSGSALLTVTPAPVNTVTVTLAAGTISLGTVGDQATALLRDANGNVLQGRTVTWQSSNPGVATISGTGVITTVGVGTTTITATSETKSGDVPLTVTETTWNAAWTLRRRVAVTATTAAVPVGYSVSVQVDHAALVAAGKSLASGNDLRILYWTGTTWVELDRVLDAGSAWNAATTTVWFKTQAGVGIASSNNNYFVYYGNSGAAAPPANNANVFLFTDDFETGTLGKWTPEWTTLWAAANTRAHRGTFSLTHPAEPATGVAVFANPALDVADIYLDAWWNVSALSNSWNVAQDIRYTGTGKYYSLLCLCIGPALGWNVAKYVTGGYTDVMAPAGNPVANTWMRVGTAISGSTYQVFLNGGLIRSIAGMTGATSGNIAFDKYIVPPGATVWIDDVVARRYVTPEPTTAAGSEQTAP